jgi:hypothetical protein
MSLGEALRYIKSRDGVEDAEAELVLALRHEDLPSWGKTPDGSGAISPRLWDRLHSLDPNHSVAWFEREAETPWPKGAVETYLDEIQPPPLLIRVDDVEVGREKVMELWGHRRAVGAEPAVARKQSSDKIQKTVKAYIAKCDGEGQRPTQLGLQKYAEKEGINASRDILRRLLKDSGVEGAKGRPKKPRR